MARVSENIDKAATKMMQEATFKRKSLAQYYREEEKVEMYLSPTYQPYFGRIMTVMINGIRILFPVNGMTYTIPRTFADEITARRMKVDEIIAKQTRMANIPVNVDAMKPGDLLLI